MLLSKRRQLGIRVSMEPRYIEITQNVIKELNATHGLCEKFIV